jgi:LacI family transcriptional regulator
VSNPFKEGMGKQLNPSRKIADDIKSAIENGTLKAGELLLPERKIAETYQVNYSTARKATQILVDEGLLEKQHGRGTVIKCNPSNSHDATAGKVGLLLNSIDWQQPHYAAMIDATSKSLSKRGIELTLASSDGEEIPSTLTEGSVGGVILMGRELLPQTRRLDACGILNISIGRPQGGNIKHVAADEHSAGFLATETLIKMGHEKIVYVGRENSEAGFHGIRQNGYKQAMIEYDLIENNCFIPVNPADPAEKQKLKAQLEKISPTAIIVSSRTYARFMDAVFHEIKIKIPEQLSVIALGSIALNMNPSSGIPFDAVGSLYSDITEQAVRAILNDIARQSREESIVTSFLIKAIHCARGSIRDIQKS